MGAGLFRFMLPMMCHIVVDIGQIPLKDPCPLMYCMTLPNMQSVITIGPCDVVGDCCEGQSSWLELVHIDKNSDNDDWCGEVESDDDEANRVGLFAGE